MRAWVTLRDGVALEGFGTLVADVIWSGREQGCVWLRRAKGSDLGRDFRQLETEEYVVPLASIAWMVPVAPDEEGGT